MKMKTFVEKFKTATWNRTVLDLSNNSMRRTGLIAKELKRLDIDVNGNSQGE